MAPSKSEPALRSSSKKTAPTELATTPKSSRKPAPLTVPDEEHSRLPRKEQPVEQKDMPFDLGESEAVIAAAVAASKAVVEAAQLLEKEPNEKIESISSRPKFPSLPFASPYSAQVTSSKMTPEKSTTRSDMSSAETSPVSSNSILVLPRSVAPELILHTSQPELDPPETGQPTNANTLNVPAPKYSLEVPGVSSGTKASVLGEPGMTLEEAMPGKADWTDVDGSLAHAEKSLGIFRGRLGIRLKKRSPADDELSDSDLELYDASIFDQFETEFAYNSHSKVPTCALKTSKQQFSMNLAILLNILNPLSSVLGSIRRFMWRIALKLSVKR